MPPTPAPLRIAFIHPDLGLGGAERLVVDAAVGLQRLGHHVELFTSFHQDGPDGRSFDETKDGTLQVHVLGASLFPPSLFGKLTLVFAILRQLHLALSFLLATSPLLPCIPFFPLPIDTPYASSADWSPRRQLLPFDVLVVDQLSAAIPLLRWLGGNRVVFYCHFPDLLLAPSRSSLSSIRALYRGPLDRFEEFTTGEADRIVVNSRFTLSVFERTFRTLRHKKARVVYPGIDVAAFGKPVVPSEADQWLVPTEPTLLSINRFEGKKNIDLAVSAFARARASNPTLRLIVAGGYDPRLQDNVSTLTRLQSLATSLSLPFTTLSTAPLTSTSPKIDSSPPSSPEPLLFLLNLSHAQKTLLLSSPHVLALLYTPSNEHFGIVPLEAMASSLPVLATSSGGPTETILDNGLSNPSTTGRLLPAETEIWAEAVEDLLKLPEDRRKAMGAAGRKRVEDMFSVAMLAREMERACREAIATGEEQGPIWQEENLRMTVLGVVMAVVMAGFLLLAISL